MAGQDSIAVANLVSIGEAAELLSVSPQTVRNLVERGELECYKLRSGHRRFDRRQLLAYQTGESVDEQVKKLCVCYSRTSTSAQREALKRQIGRVSEHASTNYGDSHEIIELSDNNSGAFVANRKGFVKLLEIILSGRLDGGIILAEFRDRIGRGNLQTLDAIAQIRNIEIVYIESDPDKTDEQLLFDDITSLLHVFNCKTYSKRGSEKRKKTLSADAIKIGRAMMEKGKSIYLIFDKLVALGYKWNDGSELTIHAVRKHIFGAQKQIDRATKAESSIQAFDREKCTKCDFAKRTLVIDAYNAYLSFCRVNSLRVLPKYVFGQYYVKKAGKVTQIHIGGKSCRTIGGIQIEGCATHLVRDYAYKAK